MILGFHMLINDHATNDVGIGIDIGILTLVSTSLLQKFYFLRLV